MQSNILSLATCTVLLTACSTQTLVKPLEVKVPLPVYCQASVPNVPEFCFPKDVSIDDIFEQAKCLLSDRHLHLAYERELKTALESCKNEAK